jgi:hypothetical protein
MNRFLDWIIDRKPWQILLLLFVSCVVLVVASTDYMQALNDLPEIPR